MIAVFCRTAALLLLILPPTSSLAAQETSQSDSSDTAPEAPLPSRIPQPSPPSPEVAMPDASNLSREPALDWHGEVDPELAWIGAPWDYLPPVEAVEPTTRPAPEPTTTPPVEAPSAPAAQAPVESLSLSQATAQTPASRAPEEAPDPPPAPSASTAPSPVEERTVVAGDSSAIAISGAGWIYVGAIPADADIDLLESASGAGETTFSFLPRETGEVLLSFQRQDLSEGSFEQRTIRLTIVDEAPTSSPSDSPGEDALEDSGTTETTGLLLTADGDGDYAEARRLRAEGNDSAALESYVRHFDGIYSADLNHEIASLAREEGELELARQFWTQNGELIGRRGREARSGLAAILADSEEDLMELQAAVNRIESYGEVPPPSVLFRLGQYHDTHGEATEIERALYYYDLLLEYYPDFEEAPLAAERSRFLRRHFLEVR